LQKKSYLIGCEITKRPYIDEDRKAYMFRNLSRAELFCSGLSKTRPIDMTDCNDKMIYSECYAAGAVTVICEDGIRKTEIELKKEDLQRRYYNNRLNADIALLARTKKTQYLKDMANCTFLVPMRTINSPNVYMLYATVGNKKGMYSYIAFSDLESFTRWSERVSGWQPLRVDCGGLRQIGRKHGFVVNPLEAAMLLKTDRIRALEEEFRRNAAAGRKE
jgi:hypothetical protein